MSQERIDAIHHYWFGELDDNLGQVDASQQQTWWAKDPIRDQEIKQLFETDVKAAIAGECESWLETPRGRLAAILLIDQFCRQIYRDTPEAFGSDFITQKWTNDALAEGIDLELHPIERVFMYLPLEHAEDKELQALSVEKYNTLFEGSSEAERDLYRGFVNYAIAHQRIIDRFGRFPHRNEILGRKSTTDEIEFLKQPGSSF